MKLNIVQSEVMDIGVTERSEAKIAANPAAFMVLSDKLYSDKILAVVRELSTNARDAHIEAGNGHLPFDVDLPNRFRPEFRIRDYGTGLSKEDVLDMYNTYFQSTRSNENNSTGGFGLGSKSPYAYSKSFSVRSFYNGKVYQFTAMIENQVPVIKFINELNTDEPNGLEVRVPVVNNNTDFDAFQRKALQLYPYFDPIPNVEDVKIEPINYKVKEKDFGMVSNSKYGHSGGEIYVIMGCVPYRVSGNDLSSIYDGEYPEVLKKAVQYAGGQINLFVDIGDVEITPSRESLSFSDETVKTIKEKLKSVTDVIKDLCQKELDEKPSLYDAVRHYHGYGQGYWHVRNSSPEGLFGADVNYHGLTWKGKNLGDLEEFNRVIRDICGKPERYRNLRLYETSSGQSFFKPTDWSFKSNFLDNAYKYGVEYIVLGDLKRGHIARLNEFRRNVNTPSLLFIDVPVNEDEVDMNAIRQELIDSGYPEDKIKWVSDLEAPERQQSTVDKEANELRSGVWNFDFSKQHRTAWGDENFRWSSEVLDLDNDEFYYILVDTARELRANDAVLNALKSLDLIDKPVWGVLKRSQKRIEDCDGAAELKTMLDDVKKKGLGKFIQKEDVKRLTLLHSLKRYHFDARNVNHNIAALYKELEQYDKAFGIIADVVEDIKVKQDVVRYSVRFEKDVEESIQRIQATLTVSAFLNIDEDKLMDNEIKQAVEKIQQDYPMLVYTDVKLNKILSSNGTIDTLQLTDVQNYVKMLTSKN